MPLPPWGWKGCYLPKGESRAVNAIVLQIFSGLALGAVLFIVASGMTLVFGTMRIINMAHGSFYMFGAYLLAVTFHRLDHNLASFGLAILLSAGIVAILGIFLEFFILRRLYSREHLLQLLATWALLLIFGDVALKIWGPSTVSGSAPSMLKSAVAMSPNLSLPTYDVFLLLAALIIGLGLWFLLQRTATGRLLRAAVEDRELLESLGINVRMLYTKAFALGSFLAAVGGAFIAPQIAVGPGIDLSILVESFVVAVVGGLGSITGALAGAIIIGLAESFGTVFFPNYSETAIYFVMIVILIIRPRGLFGREEF